MAKGEQDKNNKIRKVNYFDGLLLTSQEFQLEQDYHTTMRQAHNESFHGYGIAWGLTVTELGSLKVKVQPGVALANQCDREGILSGIHRGVEIVVTDNVDIEIPLIDDAGKNIFSVGKNLLLLIKPEKDFENREPYKGGEKPIHVVERPVFQLAIIPPEGTEGRYNIYSVPDHKLIAEKQDVMNNRETVVLASIVYLGQNPPKPTLAISTEDCKYSGLEVIEASTHKLTLHPEVGQLADSRDSSAVLQGDTLGDQKSRGLRIMSNEIAISGMIGTDIAGAFKNANVQIQGNLTITKGTDAIAGALTVQGDTTIEGNLTVLGDKTTLQIKDMKVEDNIITLNLPTDTTAVSPYPGLNTSGFEVHPGGFSIVDANLPAGWPALLWNHTVEKWKIFDYSGIEMDIGYGAPWDTLAKNGLADSLHKHSFLVNPEADPANPLNHKKALEVIPRNAGSATIAINALGQNVPNVELYVKGATRITGNSSIEGSLKVDGVVETGTGISAGNKPVKILENAILLNTYAAQGDVSLDVDRHNNVDVSDVRATDNARILWDETADVWKIGKGEKPNLIEIATIEHLPKALSRDVVQPGHGFEPGMAIYFNRLTGKYERAQSNFENTTGVFLVNRIKGDVFNLVQAGFIFFTQNVNVEIVTATGVAPSDKFRPGQYYFVSNKTPGLLTEKEPPAISNPLFLADSETSGYVLPYRPAETSHTVLKEYIDDMFVGMVNPFAMSSPPEGWFECNGWAIDRTDYARLFNKIGTTFGSGDGKYTFNVPDLRGMFVRGWDHGRGVDVGRLFGNRQFDQMQCHKHVDLGHSHTDAGHKHGDYGHAHNLPGYFAYDNPYNFYNGITRMLELASQGSTYTGYANISQSNAEITQSTANLGDPTASSAGTPRSGAETRPQNITLLYCIKI